MSLSKIFMMGIINIILVSSFVQGQVNNKFSYLKSYAGEDAVEKILTDKTLNPILKKIMGKEYRHLINNLFVAGIDLIERSIVIEGNAQHQGTSECALLDINLDRGTVTAAILSNGSIHIYSDIAKTQKNTDPNHFYEYNVPTSIKDWVAVINTNFDFRSMRPKNVIIK
jgi:hypothetical protein